MTDTLKTKQPPVEPKWPGVRNPIIESLNMSEDCDMCRFFHAAHGKETGQCRRLPPVRADDPKEYAEWPVVFCESWCGEFELSPTMAKYWAEMDKYEDACEVANNDR